jgi:hypothetical protein
LWIGKESSLKKGEALFEFYSSEVYSTYLEYLKGGSDLSLERLSLMGISLNDVKDSLAVFRSPVSGRILDLNVKRGERFEAGEYTVLRWGSATGKGEAFKGWTSGGG